MIIIINDGCGQMCNKLYNQMNVIASALEWNTKIKYYNFDLFSSFNYDNLMSKKILIIKKKSIISKVIFKLKKLSKKNTIKIENQNTINNVTEYIQRNIINQNYYFYGWPFSNLTALRKHKTEIQSFYKVSEKMCDYIFEQKKLLLQDAKTLCIGVHIRRGDYKSWRKGKFYFEDNIYKKFMDQLYELLKLSKCVFFIFSNEFIDEKFYANDKYKIVLTKGNAEQDFHLLSSMDYIISAPSTFSGMASFLGDIPRYIIQDSNSLLKIEDMHVWLSETDNDGNYLYNI